MNSLKQRIVLLLETVALRRNLTRSVAKATVFLALVFMANEAKALTTLTFEGIADGAAVGNFYDGGAGGSYGVAPIPRES